MSTIPRGYKLQLVSPDDVVVETIGLGGYDLDLPEAQAALITEVRLSMQLEMTGQLPAKDDGEG